jgi:hypothetical protein
MMPDMTRAVPLFAALILGVILVGGYMVSAPGKPGQSYVVAALD